MRDRPFTKSLKKNPAGLVTSRIDRVSGWTRNSSWMDAKFFLKILRACWLPESTEFQDR